MTVVGYLLVIVISVIVVMPEGAEFEQIIIQEQNLNRLFHWFLMEEKISEQDIL